ncbi:hypothetical protein [Salsipaludibacter albus]|uniref:hypothetical protein n=1 Tax=Salsipaludibacter albus TaxID=2849650 RepID=UPI001EE4628F|nr:hypothetical protein [Salsipaludibacter albus]MBY5163886.1 hypothetical protein [Salsipaludibacter albus]
MTTATPPRAESRASAATDVTRRGRSPRWILPAVAALATLVVTANVVAMLGRGYEFTDGGNAWNLAVHPDGTPLVVTQAGWLQHGMLVALGNDEILFQRANAVLTLVLGIALAGVLVARSRSRSTPAWETAGMAVGGGVGAFALMVQWQAPPNYKWLALQGLLVAAVGLLARPGPTGTRARSGDVALGVVLGLGGWVTFMAKPSSAALLALVALVHLWVRRTTWLRAVVGAGTALVALLVTGLAVAGSITTFMTDVQTGATLTAVLDPNHSLGALLQPDLPPMSTSTWVVLGAATVACAALLWWTRVATDRSRLPTGPAVTWVVPGAIAVAAAVVASTTWSWWPDFAIAQGTWGLALPAAAGIVLVAARRRLRGPTRGVVADTVLLLVLPAVFAFGSGNNYWHEAGRAAVFWMFAAIPLVLAVRGHPRRRRAMVAVCVVAAQLVTAALVHVGIREPYRQDIALRAMDVPVTVTTPVEGLLLSPSQAAFVEAMVGPAQAAGFRAGTGVVDLSGRTPGLLHLLDADPLGRAWLLGGYEGSTEVAIRFLAAEGCPTLATAWVLDGLGGRRSLAPEVPDALGMDLVTDYRVVATGVAFDGVRRRLLAPTRPAAEATTACQDALRERGGPWRADPLDPGTEPEETG